MTSGRETHGHEPHDHAAHDLTGHVHVHAAPDTLGAKLLIGVAINLGIFVVQIIGGLLANSLETAELSAAGFRDVGKGPGSRAGEFIEWLTIPEQKQSVLDDVTRIRHHPLVPSSIPIYGFIYDVKSGKLIEVEAATKAGAAS